MPQSGAALELDRISVTFVSPDGGRYTAIRDTTLCVAPGEFVCVVGPTGCGKSTLLNVAVGLLQDRKSTRLNSSHIQKSRMPSSA